MPDPRRRVRYHASFRSVCLVIFAALALTGCRDEPTLVFESARDSLADKDVAAFLLLVTPKARSFLQRAEEVSKKSGRTFKVLRDAKPSKSLLPRGDVVDVVENGKRCIVVVKKGRAKQQVPMRLVRGQWRIDLLEMDTFLAAIGPLQ